MKTKDILLLVGGIAIGYIASKRSWDKKTVAGVVNDVKEVAVDTVKQADCQARLLAETSTMRFASTEAGQKYRDDFMNSCMQS